MTNAQIIFNHSIDLMQQGILTGTGRYITVTANDGTEQAIEIPEEIHTFAAWKQFGYAVKKGEHAIASFPVWKYSERATESETDDGETETTGHMFMKKAFFFKASQVEKITGRHVKN